MVTTSYRDVNYPGFLLDLKSPLKEIGMKVHCLEIVASDADAGFAIYEAAHSIKFGPADLLLGGARTTPLADRGSVGVRGPLRDMEECIVKPYCLVDDIDAALDAAFVCVQFCLYG